MVVPNEVTVQQADQYHHQQQHLERQHLPGQQHQPDLHLPQYTTINENNEAVTNIGNPIIYNNETKQYYTYGTVTSNYYYITYEAPTPSPSPDPDPPPTPGTWRRHRRYLRHHEDLQEIKAVLVSGFAGITEKASGISA